MSMKLFLTSTVVAMSILVTGCGSEKSNRPTEKEEIPEGASAPLNNRFGAWAPLKAQVIDYDGNSSMVCAEGQTSYFIYLKTGMVIDQKRISINLSCPEAAQLMDFSCEYNGRAYVLYAVAKGEVVRNGNLGVYQNQNDCQGYAYALKHKQP